MEIERNIAFPLKDPWGESEKVNLYEKNKKTKRNDTQWKHKKKRHGLLYKFTVEHDIGSKFNTTTEQYSQKNTLCISKVSNELFPLFPFAVSTQNDDMSDKLFLLSSYEEIFDAGNSIDNNYLMLEKYCYVSEFRVLTAYFAYEQQQCCKISQFN